MNYVVTYEAIVKEPESRPPLWQDTERWCLQTRLDMCQEKGREERAFQVKERTSLAHGRLERHSLDPGVMSTGAVRLEVLDFEP